MATRFSHLCIDVKDVTCAQSFYTDYFGLRFEKQVVNNDGVPIIVYLTLGDYTLLELWQREDNAPTHSHLSFHVDDIRVFTQALQAKGISVSEPVIRSSGNTLAFLQDPDGNTIELLCSEVNHTLSQQESAHVLHDDIGEDILRVVIQDFRTYKEKAEGAFAQLTDGDLHWTEVRNRTVLPSSSSI